MHFVSNTQRNILYAIIALGAAIFLWITIPKHTFETQGIFLPTKHSAQVIIAPSNEIKLVLNKPKNAKVIGHINLERHFQPGNNSIVFKQMENTAFSMAKKHGATGLIINEIGISDPQTTPAVLMVYVLQATALSL